MRSPLKLTLASPQHSKMRNLWQGQLCIGLVARPRN